MAKTDTAGCAQRMNIFLNNFFINFLRRCMNFGVWMSRKTQQNQSPETVFLRFNVDTTEYRQ